MPCRDSGVPGRLGVGAGRALQRFLGSLAPFAADLHGALSVPGAGLCPGRVVGGGTGLSTGSESHPGPGVDGRLLGGEGA